LADPNPAPALALALDLAPLPPGSLEDCADLRAAAVDDCFAGDEEDWLEAWLLDA
jgi:hypothetical protein